MFANNLNKLFLIISFNLFSYHVLSQNNILVSSINSENNPAIILKSNSNLFLGIFKYEFQISNLTKDTLYLFSMPSKEMSTYFGINYLKNNKNTYEVYPDDKDKNTLKLFLDSLDINNETNSLKSNFKSKKRNVTPYLVILPFDTIIRNMFNFDFSPQIKGCFKSLIYFKTNKNQIIPLEFHTQVVDNDLDSLALNYFNKKRIPPTTIELTNEGEFNWELNVISESKKLISNQNPFVLDFLNGLENRIKFKLLFRKISLYDENNKNFYDFKLFFNTIIKDSLIINELNQLIKYNPYDFVLSNIIDYLNDCKNCSSEDKINYLKNIYSIYYLKEEKLRKQFKNRIRNFRIEYYKNGFTKAQIKEIFSDK